MSAVRVTYDLEAALSSCDWVVVMGYGHTNRLSKPREVCRLTGGPVSSLVLRMDLVFAAFGDLAKTRC